MLRIRLFILITILLLAFIGTSIFATYADYRIARNPVPETKRSITVYSSLPVEYMALVGQKFEEKTGVKVNYSIASDEAIYERLLQEQDNPRTDVWLGSTTEQLYSARRKVLLSPYQSSATERIPAPFKDVDGYWTGVFVDVIGFAYNKDFITGNKAPKSWNDLAEGSGRLVMADPTASIPAGTIVTVLVALRGEQQAFSFLKKLHAKTAQYPKFLFVPARMVLMGEADIAVLPAREAIRYIREGFPLSLAFPEEGTGFQVLCGAIVRNSPNPADAAVFIDWLTSKEAQEFAHKTNLSYYGTNPETVSPAYLPELSKVRLIAYDRKWESLQRLTLVNDWMQKVRLGTNLQ